MGPLNLSLIIQSFPKAIRSIGLLDERQAAPES